MCVCVCIDETVEPAEDLVSLYTEPQTELCPTNGTADDDDDESAPLKKRRRQCLAECDMNSCTHINTGTTMRLCASYLYEWSIHNHVYKHKHL